MIFGEGAQRATYEDGVRTRSSEYRELGRLVNGDLSGDVRASKLVNGYRAFKGTTRCKKQKRAILQKEGQGQLMGWE